MSTVIYIHGTGVREPTYTLAYEKVRSVLKGDESVKVERCYWGEQGARLHGGLSVPDYLRTRAVGEAPDEDVSEVLWELLEVDPLYELRILEANAEEVANPWAPSETACILIAAERLREEPAPPVYGLVSRFSASEVFVAAVAQVLESGLVEIPGASYVELKDAVARAIVAQFLAAAPETLRVQFTVPVRDELTAAVENALGEAAKGGLVSDFVLRQLKGLAANWGTRRVLGQRGSLSDRISAPLGDILLYQARGEGIRRTIEGVIRMTQTARPGDPIILLAHSLGGIAAVDLAILSRQEPLVHTLVTVGSQAPLLYELNALVSLPYEDRVPTEDRLPEPFPKWINFFDRRDFLSYQGAKLFGSRIEDREVDNELPFPSSHSGYWDNDTFWRSFRELLP